MRGNAGNKCAFAIGKISPSCKYPALPSAVPAPSSTASKTTVRNPASCNASAAVVPTMPPPMTAISASRLFAVERNPRGLHFLIRQEPDHRFIVQIDDLNPVAERIEEIATERRDQRDPVFLRELLFDLVDLP